MTRKLLSLICRCRGGSVHQFDQLRSWELNKNKMCCAGSTFQAGAGCSSGSERRTAAVLLSYTNINNGEYIWKIPQHKSALRFIFTCWIKLTIWQKLLTSMKYLELQPKISKNIVCGLDFTLLLTQESRPSKAMLRIPAKHTKSLITLTMVVLLHTPYNFQACKKITLVLKNISLPAQL